MPVLRVEMLPAAHGDALWIEWGSVNDPRRMIVDGGPAHEYSALRSRVLALPPEQRHFELLVVTHIDTDHIDGVVRLLRDRAIGATFGDIWFNGWEQIGDSEPDEQGGKQGEFLGALLAEGGHPWNEAFGGGAVAIPDDHDEDLPRFDIDGLKLTVVGPSRAELDELKAKWIEDLPDDWPPGDHQKALEELEKRRDLTVPEGVEDELGDEDPSTPNRTSIALVIEHDEASVLLTGDSHADVLQRGIERLLDERTEERLTVGAFKLPHHGSRRNLTADLLDIIDTKRYLISTNGAKFHHPHEEAIERILRRHQGSRSRPQLWFNYRSPDNERWADENLQRDLRFDAVFPEGVAYRA